MSEQCPFCVEARTEAAKQVHKWLKGLVRLTWRVEQNPDHEDAGWIIQQVLDGWSGRGTSCGLPQVSPNDPRGYREKV